MIDAQEFRHVFGHLPTGVTVLTAFVAGKATGMAVNSVTSVSLEPPLLLVCPAKSSTTWPDIRAARHFCVNVLASHQEELCRQFAARAVDRFGSVAWHTRSSGPALDEAVAWLDCELQHEHDAGDHTIAVARAIAMDVHGARDPLVFLRGRYGVFADR